MNKNIIIAIALGILVIVAALQTVQLFILKDKLSDSEASFKTSTGKINTQTTNPIDGNSPSVDSLPSMVGGC